MKRYIIRTGEGDVFTAASKARQDAETIALRMGYGSFVFRGERTAEGSISGILRLAQNGVRNWRRLIQNAENGSQVILQYPHYPMKSALLARLMIPIGQRRKGLYFIALVHDLDSVRELHGKAAVYSDHKLLPLFDRIICHNERMKELLLRWGIPEEKLVVLGVFDYLTNTGFREHQKEDGIIIAGNLSPEKCAYVQEVIRTTRLPIHLYGKGLGTENLPEHITAHGAVPPEELPGELEGGFGLVWDGPEVNSCTGPAGEYLRINNPHKLSLYLAAGLPVIVWKEAAAADFVIKNGVGLAMENLKEAEERIRTLSAEDYCRMRTKAAEVGKQLRNGFFLQKALEQITAE